MAEEIPKEVVEAPVKFLAKRNCKDCYGRGFVTRTTPMGRDENGEKKMSKHKTLCHCVTEIKTPEPDECVVPKVATNEPKVYANSAQPLH
jgi:hypothetical protein